jgi:hypothetical protein
MGDGGTGQRVTVQGAIAAQLEGGTGREILRGGASSDFIRGGGGDDELFGGDSSGAPDVLIGGAGNDLLDGQDGPDRMSGGAGGDILRDTSTQETRDTAEYFTPAGQPDDFRTTGVRVSLGDGRNDGSVEDELVPGDGGFKDDVEGSVTAIAGTDFADVLVGNDLPNSISGFGGADDITRQREPVVDMIEVSVCTRSGCRAAMTWAIMPPIEAPTTCARSSPSAPIRPAPSAAMSASR